MVETAIFRYLSEDERSRLSTFLTPNRFQEGDLVLKQGEIGDGLFLITSGEASVSTCLPGDVEVSLASLRKGDFFGEVSLLTTDPIAASVFAKTDLHCLFLSHETLYGMHVVDPLFTHKLLQGLLDAISKRLRGSYAQITELFIEWNRKKMKEMYVASALNQDALLKEEELPMGLEPDKKLLHTTFPEVMSKKFENLLTYMSLIKAKSHTVLYQTGELDESCYFLLHGAIQSVIESKGIQSKIAVYGPSHIFGQLEFVDGGARVYSAIVREDAILLKMGKAQKERIMREDPKLWCEFYLVVGKRIARILRTVNINLLRLQSEMNYV